MGPDKIRAVLKWPQYSTVKELQKLLGFANFYHPFIWGFSVVAVPLTNLLRGGKIRKLIWSKAALHTFSELKESFCMAPVLQQLNPL